MTPSDAAESGVGELLYEATVSFTEVVEYGLSMSGVFSGSVGMPAAGARFDVHFRGAVRGPKLNGTLAGIDYITVRADGRTQLHIHARLTIDDGENVAYHAEGVAHPRPGAREWVVRETVSFVTASARHAWLNQVQ